MAAERREHAGWTPTAFKELIDARFAERDLRYEQRFVAQEKAVAAALAAQERLMAILQDAAHQSSVKADAATEKRFESVNAFRAQLTEQAATFMTRAEAEARLLALTEKVDESRSRINVNNGRIVGLNASWGYLVGAATIVGIVVSVLLALR